MVTLTYEQIWRVIPQEISLMFFSDFPEAEQNFDIWNRVVEARSNDIASGLTYKHSSVSDADYKEISKEAPREFVELVLLSWPERFFLCPDGKQLRTGRPVKGDREITPIDAFRQYGKKIVEACEKGVTRL